MQKKQCDIGGIRIFFVFLGTKLIKHLYLRNGNIIKMEPVKLHITRLGLIRNADIEMTPIMVFSGESGLGKSYVAILCHYFFHVWLNPKRLDSFFKELQSSRGINFFNTTDPHSDNGVALEITRKELEKWLAKDAVAYLQYMLGYDELSAELTVSLPNIIPDHIEFMYEQELMGLNNAEDLYHKLTILGVTYRFRRLGIQDESPYAYVLRYAIVNKIFGDVKKLDYSFVLPPSRGSYMSEEVVGRTGLYKSFIQGMRELEQVQEVPDSISEQLVELCRKVMDGEVKKAGDKYIYITHGETLPISAAASSIKEIAPLQLMISKRDISKASILIEEPEAHLHPLKQRMMADVIATMNMGNASMQITTHSDYFIRRINDLMRLHILKGKMSNNCYTEFCKKNDFIADLTLDPDKLSAYFLERTEDGLVKINKQHSLTGIPFDTFKAINGKPLADSAMLYELTVDGI